MILILKILLHNVYKIINLRYPTYVYQFLIFLIITKIDCWPVFKLDPNRKGFTKWGSGKQKQLQTVSTKSIKRQHEKQHRATQATQNV